MRRLAAVLMVFSAVFCDAAEKQRPKVSSEEANAALSRYDAEQSKLSKQFEDANSRTFDIYAMAFNLNKEEVLKSLADAQAAATQAADLDEAIRVRDAITYIKALVPTLPTTPDKATQETISKLEREIARLNSRLRRAPPPAPPVPREAVRFNGHAYLVVPGPVTWHLATEWCENNGGSLVRIESEEEHKFVGELLRKTSQIEAWIGGSDEETEGVWKFPDGSPLKFTKFGPAQPNNADGFEHYLVYGRRGWYDIYAGKRTAFVCEWSE